ncbi:zinc finger protein 35-like isoform X1 [Littorina saxatilis]|uniref:zinc finger protein 35-like isoform X1 n=1 Tax=Littorina saxatilis TaxID=31220 RepID=UPI0038B4F520
MAICGTCNNKVPRNCRKKIDRTVSGVCFRRVLSEYFDFNPSNSEVCAQCDHTLEQIVRINMKLEKLTIQRNTIITDFGAKISHTRVLSQTTELEVTSRTPSKQVSSTVTSETEDSSQLRSQSPSHSQPESPPVFPQIPEIKVEPLDDDDDNAAFENESSDTTEETAAKHATMRPKSRSQQVQERLRPTRRKTRTHPLPHRYIKRHAVEDNDNVSNDEDDDAASTFKDNEDGDTSAVDIKEDPDMNADTYASYSKKEDMETFRCGFCKARFKESERLSAHMSARHEKKKRTTVQCGKCLKKFKNVSVLVAHLEDFHTVRYKTCLVCSKTCFDKFDFEVHMKAHRVNNEKVICCKACSLVFPSTEELNKHRKKVHYNNTTFLCEWCSKTFTNRSNFICHTRIHTGEKPYKCEHCPSAFMESTKLKIHLAKHSGVKAYACDKCPKSFPYRSGLMTHMKIHIGDKKYKCEQCPAAFLLPLGLRNHMRAIHSDARPFVCDQCQASFKHPSHLKRHKMLHTGEKPFKCHLCPATFIQKGNMKIHMKVHEKDNPRMESSAARRQALEKNRPPPPAPTENVFPTPTSPPDQPVMGYFPHMMTMGMFLPHQAYQ